jgi:hypothetical protein
MKYIIGTLKARKFSQTTDKTLTEIQKAFMNQSIE